MASGLFGNVWPLGHGSFSALKVPRQAPSPPPKSLGPGEHRQAQDCPGLPRHCPCIAHALPMHCPCIAHALPMHGPAQASPGPAQAQPRLSPDPAPAWPRYAGPWSAMAIGQGRPWLGQGRQGGGPSQERLRGPGRPRSSLHPPGVHRIFLANI